MRWLVLVGTLGCAFRSGVSGGGGGGGSDAGGSADARPIDAASDAMLVHMIDASDWPCGTKPAALGTTLDMQANGGATDVSLATISVGGTTDQRVIANAGSQVSVTLDYTITDTACASNCVDQIEIGFTPGNRTGCPFDASVSKATGASGTWSGNLTAPATPGSYDIRTNIGQNYSCTYMGANSWWNGTPPADWTIAKLCVQ